MAGLSAIHDVGQAVVALLDELGKVRGPFRDHGTTPTAVYKSIGEFAKPNAESELSGQLTLACYRVLPSGHARPQPRTRGTQRPSWLGLELHYLLTAWHASALDEQTALAWAMLELHRHAIFDSAMLRKGGGVGWERDEIVHVVSEPLTHEAMFRIWDGLAPKYRLSAAYCARVVNIRESRETTESLRVVETEFGYASFDFEETELDA